MAVIAAWAFAASSGSTTYETTLDTEGVLACNCPGFVFKKKDKERACKHTRQLAPYVPSLLSNLLTAGEVAQRLGLIDSIPLSSSHHARPAATLPALPDTLPAPLPRKRRFDFEE